AAYQSSPAMGTAWLAGQVSNWTGPACYFDSLCDCLLPFLCEEPLERIFVVEGLGPTIVAHAWVFGVARLATRSFQRGDHRPRSFHIHGLVSVAMEAPHWDVLEDAHRRHVSATTNWKRRGKQFGAAG